MELLITKSQLATMREKKEYYRQELMKALEHAHHGKRSRKISKRKRTFALLADEEVDPKGKAPIGTGYDPRRPHYDLNGYMPKESHSYHDESNDTEESVANNFNTAGDANTAGPSGVTIRAGC